MTRPVRDELLVFGQPYVDAEAIADVVDVLRSGWLDRGPRVERFESEFRDYVGAQHARALNSCSAGLFLALSVSGIGPGDEVVTTPLTFAATVHAIEHVGATPVLADIDPETLNLDPPVSRVRSRRERARSFPCISRADHARWTSSTGSRMRTT